ncbi:MAG: hypothetical protein QT00_C0002G0071 [archaeon GW2011_AR5]|nr:MAG: hypothetical protein QT00_C0002G0071 [archaeon GW2011_AR5]
MDVFRVLTDKGSFDVPFELPELGTIVPYAQLHRQAPPGHAIFAAYSHNRFDNAFHDRDVKRYNDRKRSWYGEITHDSAEDRMHGGEQSPSEGHIPILYKSNDGRDDEILIKAWAPKPGLVVPIADNVKGYRFFQPFTLIPEKTVPFEERAEAERAYLEFDLPAVEISGFYRPDNFKGGKRFVGRDFDPDFGDYGRFYVLADRRPLDSGVDGVASRPAYAEHNVIGEIDIRTASEAKA